MVVVLDPVIRISPSLRPVYDTPLFGKQTEFMPLVWKPPIVYLLLLGKPETVNVSVPPDQFDPVIV